jgi:hypothetical protein
MIRADQEHTGKTLILFVVNDPPFFQKFFSLFAGDFAIAYGFKILNGFFPVLAEGLSAEQRTRMAAAREKGTYPVHKAHRTGIDTYIAAVFCFVIGVAVQFGTGKNIGVICLRIVQVAFA